MQRKIEQIESNRGSGLGPDASNAFSQGRNESEYYLQEGFFGRFTFSQTTRAANERMQTGRKERKK